MPKPLVFAFVDAPRRTFVALNRAGDHYHVVTPARLDDRRVADSIVTVGQLVCNCPGGTFRGKCYVTKAVEAKIAADRAAREHAL